MGKREAVVALVKAGGMVNYNIYPTVPTVSWTMLASWKKLIREYIGIDFVDHVANVQLSVRLNINDTERRRAFARLPDLGRLETLSLAGASKVRPSHRVRPADKLISSTQHPRPTLMRPKCPNARPCSVPGENTYA